MVLSSTSHILQEKIDKAESYTRANNEHVIISNRLLVAKYEQCRCTGKVELHGGGGEREYKCAW